VQDEIHVRPLRWRAYSLVAAGVLLVVFTMAGLTLSGTTANGGVLMFSDHLGMIGVGILLAGLVALLGARPKLDADEAGVRVRNGIGRYELPWTAVRSVRFNRGAVWASLELINDDVVPVMAIQSLDKQRAVVAVKALRELLAQHTPT